jgi:UDP-glucose 4-epimerase
MAAERPCLAHVRRDREAAATVGCRKNRPSRPGRRKTIASVYLVTGGCGFIGAHLVRALARQGHRVRVLDDLSSGRAEALPPGVELTVGDVRDRSAVRAALEGAAGCFHLAAVASVERSRLEWLESHRVNLGGTVTVLEAARDASPHPVPVVHASSAAVYGEVGELPLKEEGPVAPTSAYGADKLSGELHAAIGRHLFGLPALGLRFFNVYGPGQQADSPYSGVITRFADQIARGEAVTLFGTGRQTRDLVYVHDVVRALLAAMERLPGASGVVNVCSGREVSVLEVAQHLAVLAGKPLRVTREPPRPGDILRSVGCPARLTAVLGVVAATPLREGLERTLGWHDGRRRPDAARRPPGRVDPWSPPVTPAAGRLVSLADEQGILRLKR